VRVLGRLAFVFLGLVSICIGGLAAVALWVLFGFPGAPRSSAPPTPGLRAEAANDASLARRGALPSRPGAGREAEASIQPASCTGEPSLCQPGSASAGAAEARAGSDQPQPVRTETQDRGPATSPAAAQREFAGSLADLSPAMRCSADLCAAKYRSFTAADCTYQPYGGGPRSICEISISSADATPQSARVAADAGPQAKEPRVAVTAPEFPESVTAVRAGPQCNLAFCAATHRTFNAADCTYQPYGGGPRRICEPQAGNASSRQNFPDF
jgi:hypothetical protein